MMRAVIYCRCSTEEERQVDALKKQVEEARGCVHERGWTLVDEFVESKSGTTSKGRREYSRLFEELLTDSFDIIVIKSQDRLMRNTKDWYLFLDRMQSNNKQLYLYIERKFFTTEDSLITGIKAILAEEYSRELSKKIVNAHRNRQQKGERVVITNRTFGYDKLADGRVVVHEAQREACVKLFTYVVQYGCRTTSRLLAAEGIFSKSGKAMSPATIRRIVINPMYKGVCVMNKRQFDFETKKVMKMPENEWIYAAGMAPPIVDEELWQRANDAVAKRARSGNVDGCYLKGSNPGKYVLSGKLICGSCGKPYYRVFRRACTSQDKMVHEWKCSNYLQAGRKSVSYRGASHKVEINLENGCDNVHLDEEILFEVLERVNGMYFQSQQLDKARTIHMTMEVLEKVLNQDKNTAKLQQLERKISEIRGKKQILLEKLLDGVISDGDYQVQNKRFEEVLCEAERELNALYQQDHKKTNLKARLQRIKDKLEQGGFERATTIQMLDHVKKIIVHEWKLEIEFDVSTLYIDLPFSPNTEKGRYLDRLRIMELLKEEPKITAKKIAAIMDRSPYMIWNRMQELKKGGYISYNGLGGKGVWEVQKEFPNIKT